MSRADISGEIAERVLGHKIRGVAGVYDRYSYEQQKADALLKLSELIKQIVGAYRDSWVLSSRYVKHIVASHRICSIRRVVLNPTKAISQ